MRFAKAVFLSASVIGALILIPMYFLESAVATTTPPAITHPEYYYGFASVTLVWQLAYFMISTDPVRFRPLMPVATLAKLLYVVTILALWFAGRVSAVGVIAVTPDIIFAVLFIIAYRRTPRA